MSVLVRKFVKNGDKTNIRKVNLVDGLKCLGKTELDIAERVKWLNIEDIFFHGTKDYIRIVHLAKETV
jgi:hypothetical protein